MTLNPFKSFKFTSFLGLIFFVSGASSLMYQVAWQRLLTLHYGVGSISIALIVSVYMAGLGFGAILGGYIVERLQNRISMYILVEFLLGCFGLASLPVLGWLGSKTAGSSYLVSFFCMWGFLVIPTLLMGVTLPVFTKIFNVLSANFVQTVSFLYFVNTLGAVFGALFAGYVVISFFGLDTAVYVASFLNFSLALAVYVAGKSAPSGTLSPTGPPSAEQVSTFPPVAAFGLVLITGFLAIGYEIVWFRVVTILVKSSPYAFCSMLAVYLFGIALGSYGMGAFLRRTSSGIDKKSVFFFIQVLIALYTALVFIAYYYLTEHTGFGLLTRLSFEQEVHPELTLPAVWTGAAILSSLYSALDVFFWSALFVLIPTVLMGASFPLVSGLALSDADSEGKTVGLVYFFNVLGNVVGGLVTGLILLPLLGTELTLIVFSVTGFLFLLPATSFCGRPVTIAQKSVATAALCAVVIAVFPRGGQLYLTMHGDPGKDFSPVLEEGIDGVVVDFHKKSDINNFKETDRLSNYINGLKQGCRPCYSFHVQALEAMSYAPSLDNVLVIGYGTGGFTETILASPRVKRVTVVELYGTVVNNLKKFKFYRDMLADKKLRLVINDGRRFLMATDEKYDLITIDPLRSTTAYSNNIYSREFHQILYDHLKPKGVALMFQDSQLILPKTRAMVFPYLRKHLWYCLGSNAPFERKPDVAPEVLANFSPGLRRGYEKELKHWIGRRYEGDREYVLKKTEPWPILEDLKPVCEYYIGLKVRQSAKGRIPWDVPDYRKLLKKPRAASSPEKKITEDAEKSKRLE